MVGDEVFQFVQSCFASNAVPEEVNKTLIALIPKSENPENIKMFRPISLCNVTYKIIMKIIVARMRPFVHKIMSPCQSSSIPGRSTNDNIIITQEIIKKKKEKKEEWFSK